MNSILFQHIDAHGDNSMQSLYSLSRALMPKIEPVKFVTKKEIRGIFSVPIDNVVATNKIGNAITILSFNGEKIKYKTLKRNFLDDVGRGHNIFMPVFSNDIISYSMSRGFLIFNIKNKKSHYYSIAGHFDYELGTPRVISSENKIFLFNVFDLKTKGNTKYLRLLDLSTDTAKLIKEKKVESGWWTTLGEIILFYDKGELKALNLNFEEIKHPLVSNFEAEKENDFGVIHDLIVHPSLPFAVMIEEKYDKEYNCETTIWVISWGETNSETKKPSMVKLFNENTGSFFKFTNDGKWMIFKNHNNSPAQFILMPVGPEYQYYLGNPICLGDVPRSPSGHGTSAMTRNPAGLVVSECVEYGKKYQLKKWDFTEAECLLDKKR